MLLCGADEVFLLDVSAAEKGTIQKLWSWRAAQRSELPPAIRGSYGGTDDCKLVDGGSRILISSSSGGCAVVGRPSGRVLWYARVPNAHSLELLPHDRVVAASSWVPEGTGSRLFLFDLAHSDRPVWSTPLSAAHGVVWDEKRRRLWALGDQELRSYKLQDWEGQTPSLKLAASHRLPDEGGHDLQPVPSSNDLVVTTGFHVYLFDRDKGEFRLHPELGGKGDVKCVSVHPLSGRTVFIQGNGKDYWNDVFHLLAPSGMVHLPGERLYKGRWLPPQAGGEKGAEPSFAH